MTCLIHYYQLAGICLSLSCKIFLINIAFSSSDSIRRPWSGCLKSLSLKDNDVALWMTWGQLFVLPILLLNLHWRFGDIIVLLCLLNSQIDPICLHCSMPGAKKWLDKRRRCIYELVVINNVYRRWLQWICCMWRASWSITGKPWRLLIFFKFWCLVAEKLEDVVGSVHIFTVNNLLKNEEQMNGFSSKLNTFYLRVIPVLHWPDQLRKLQSLPVCFTDSTFAILTLSMCFTESTYVIFLVLSASTIHAELRLRWPRVMYVSW